MVGPFKWHYIQFVLITIWQWFPFSASVLLAGLKSLPKDVFEAAKVDGAKAGILSEDLLFQC